MTFSHRLENLFSPCRNLVPTPVDLVTTPDDLVIKPDSLVLTPDDLVITPDSLVLRPDDLVIMPDNLVPTSDDLVPTPFGLPPAPPINTKAARQMDGRPFLFNFFPIDLLDHSHAFAGFVDHIHGTFDLARLVRRCDRGPQAGHALLDGG